jgi:putative spermidine/putrescine transport system substrate-binding protein
VAGACGSDDDDDAGSVDTTEAASAPTDAATTAPDTTSPSTAGATTDAPDGSETTATTEATAAAPTLPADLEVEDELVIAGPAGSIQPAIRTAMATLEQEYGVKITYIEGTSSSAFSQIQAEAQSGQKEIDIAFNNDATVELGAGQGLWAELDMDLLPNAEQAVKEFAFPTDIVGDPPVAVRWLLIPLGLVYNTDIFTQNGWDPPTSWADLYDPKFASCTIPLSPESGVPYLPILNNLNSGDYTDLDVTLEKFEAIRDQVPVWPKTSPEALEFVQQGVGCLAPAQQGRTLEQRAAGAPIDFVYAEEGVPFLGGTSTIIKDSPHPVAAHLLLNEMLSADIGQQLLTETYYSSVNVNVQKATSGDAAEVPVASEFADFGFIDIPRESFADLDTWIQRWTQLAAG